MSTTPQDKLSQMWQQQADFMKLLTEKRDFPVFPVELTTKAGQKFIAETVHHCADELHEARQHLKNSKAHRVSDVAGIDVEAYLEELVDAQHLLFEVVIASGFSVDEFFNKYIAKGKVNVERINNGY
jgi:thymidine phosphorylase